MALTERELLELKQEVDDAKTTVAELNGQQTALMKQLKDDWGCKSIKEAEKKLEEMDKTIVTMDKSIAKGIEELELLLNPEEE